jgi:hypothetical protein
VKKRILNPLRIGALAALLAVVPGVVNCDHESPQALYIMDVMARTPGSCTLKPNQSVSTVLMAGKMDLMLTNTYLLFPHVRNMMESINTITGEGTTSPQPEVHIISVKRAKVYVDMGEFTPSATPIVTGLLGDKKAALALGFKYGTEGVEWIVNASMEPRTESVVMFQAIPPELGNLLYTKMLKLTETVDSPAVWITVYVSVIGETLDGHVIQSNEFAFPIELCMGCLVSPFCSETPTVGPCDPGQDAMIDGSLCRYASIHPTQCPSCP